YIYLSVPFVKRFGLNELSVRLPSALFGALGVIPTYVITFLLFKNQLVSSLASFFLAISPWHIQFSRGAFEANVALTFFLVGISCLLFIGKNGQRRYFLAFFAGMSFVASVYTYNGFLLFLPLASILFTAFFLRVRKIPVRVFLIFFLVFWIFSLPLLIQSVQARGGPRFAQVGIVKRVVWEKEVASYPPILQRREVIVPILFLKNYLSHFSPEFLVMTGDINLRHGTGKFGVLFLWEGVFALIGLLSLWKKRELFYLFIPWIVLFPVAASLTKESPHALRSIMLLPVPQIFAAWGIQSVDRLISWKKFASILLGILIGGTFLLFLYEYFVNYPISSSRHWQYGYKDLVTTYANKKESIDKMIVTTEYAQPYIFFLFYLQYNPSRFQSEAVFTPVNDWGVSKVASFDKLEFRHITYNADKHLRNVILVGTPEEIPESIPGHNLYFLNGEVAFRMVKQ
ncbi:MAG TPA: hypothetical protein VJB91_00015, partial [Patescibacteria group bacterium]|nr:hypothetical protein [Patescibacteria group bacterium]